MRRGLMFTAYSEGRRDRYETIRTQLPYAQLTAADYTTRTMERGRGALVCPPHAWSTPVISILAQVFPSDDV